MSHAWAETREANCLLANAKVHRVSSATGDFSSVAWLNFPSRLAMHTLDWLTAPSRTS